MLAGQVAPRERRRPNIVCGDGLTPLDLADACGATAIAALLEQHGGTRATKRAEGYSDVMRNGHAFMFFALVVAAGGVRQGPDRARLLNPSDPEFARPAPAVSTIRLDTNKGSMRLELQREWSPSGVDRFYNLVRFGYYDGARFFRIRKGTWAQFGINGDPEVARAWRSRTIPDDPRVRSNVRGSLAYAFKDPDGRTTQVFINLRDNSTTHDVEPFVPFARITEGLEVADSLYAEYGEAAGGGIRAGKQDPVFAGGNAFLSREFPKLDYIVRAVIESR